MTDAAMRVLEDFLGSPGAPADSLSAVAIDGYLTAIAIGPELIMPSRWMAGLWGGEPVFEGHEQAQAVLNALMLRHNDILHQLDTAPKRFRPWYMAEADQPASAEQAAEWARGFWKAMMLTPETWGPLVHDHENRLLLAPILCFIDPGEGHGLIPVDPDEVDDLLCDAAEIIPTIIPGIRAYWRSGTASPQQPARSKRPGRNDPCPCGSGKKYKRCCGAN